MQAECRPGRRMKLLDGVKAGATLSLCGTYRYALTRSWSSEGAGHVLWIMLNPSTADADVDDPTIRRCQTFAYRWGYDGITVVNLFALRSKDPRALLNHPDPVGPANDVNIASLAKAAGTGLLVAAWGADGRLHGRSGRVRQTLAATGRPLHTLGLTKFGHPRHPLYVRGDTTPVEWTP